MTPPTQLLNLDVEAISGICGSISIACWIVVFSPQIIEQWQRGNADSLSVQFVAVWLLGDVFNILGGWLQGILPTMMILAVYYTIADMVLIAQCFYYRGFTLRDPTPTKKCRRSDDEDPPTDRTALLPHHADWTNLSPAVPLVPENAPEPTLLSPLTTLQTVGWNGSIVAMVCAAGVAGWALARRSTPQHDDTPPGGELSFNVLGQVFGYLCTVAYIGSRLPQLILNHRRRSTDGLSMLFFLFACLGNVMYVLSILAYRAPCSRYAHSCDSGEEARQYGRYILVNMSWLAGSAITLLLDLCVFAQYFVYGEADAVEAPSKDGRASPENQVVFVRGADEIEAVVAPSDDEDDASSESEGRSRRELRPLMRRGDSTF